MDRAVKAAWLLALFGHNAGLAVSAVVLPVLTLLVVAFWQGRAISIWPPTIGPRARPGADELPDKAPADRMSQDGSMASGVVLSGRVTTALEVSDAKIFYEAIATTYDERNSANLLATHMDTLERIEQAQEGKPGIRVLDLGGGTGKNIATHFFNDEDIRWDYVDSSPAMADQMRRNLAGRPLSRHLAVYVGDINDLDLLGLKEEAYDVILLSLVLSSMPRMPDFATIAGLLAPRGSLIISDINPDYTQAHPYYEVRADDSSMVAMRMNPVRLLEMLQRLNSAALKLTELTSIGKGCPPYSFNATFTSAARPSTNGGNQDHRAVLA